MRHYRFKEMHVSKLLPIAGSRGTSISGLGFSVLGTEVLLLVVKHCFLGSCKQNYSIKPPEQYCSIMYFKRAFKRIMNRRTK